MRSSLHLSIGLFCLAFAFSACVENTNAAEIKAGIERRKALEANGCYVREGNQVVIASTDLCLEIACEADNSYCQGGF